VKRLFWHKEVLFSSETPVDDGKDPVLVEQPDANLVGSLTDEGKHMPLLDIDYDAQLLPSSTPGHFHLYLNKGVDWDKYQKVLIAMGEAGLIQKGFMDWSLKRGQSFLRPPGVMKVRSSGQRGLPQGEPTSVPLQVDTAG